MKLSHFAVRHPVVIGMLLIVLGVFGIFALSSINVEFMGDVSAPSIIVVAIYPGADAEDVEEDVTSILEDNFVTLPDFKSVSSASANSYGSVEITFRDGIDPYDKITEVRDRINKLMPELPSGLQGTPEALVGGAEMLPIFSFSISEASRKEVSGTDSSASLLASDTGSITNYITETLRPQLTAIGGVSDVEVSGGQELQVNVELQLEQLEARSISALTVYQILGYSNQFLPAGTGIFQGREVAIRYRGELASLEDIRQLPVGSTSDNVVIRLEDVASVTLAYPESDSYVTDGYKPLVLVDVMKRSDGNTLSIVSQIKEVLSRAEQETGLQFNIISDDSRIVTASMKTVIMSGIGGILMAVLVIFLFLGNFRATLIIALSIPLSLLFTFIAMKLTGITVNLMSLSGMVVALGMVVDGSIVMIEQVFRHYNNPKYTNNPEDAIFLGADEVGLSIFASTATTVVVFVPIAALSGVVGMILKDVSLTLIMALTASLLSAVVIVPFLMGLLLKPKAVAQSDTAMKLAAGRKRSWPQVMKFQVDKIMATIERKYRKALNWSLTSWKFIIFLALVVLVATVLVLSSLSIAFIPSTDNSDFYINLKFPGGYPLASTNAQMEKVADLLYETVPEVQDAVFFVGMKESVGSSQEASNQGYIHVVLVPVAERNRSIHEIILQVQQVISSSIPGVTAKVSNGGFDKLLGYVSGGGGYGLTFVGEDMEKLYASAATFAEYLQQDREVVSVEMDTDFDTQALTIDMVHEYMSSLGITSYEAGITSAILFQGMDVGRFRSGDNRYTIHLYSDKTDKTITLEDFNSIKIISSLGIPVSLSNISQLHQEQSISQINHKNRSKIITVSATLVSENTAGVDSRANQWLANNPLPQGISTQAGGITELMGDSLPSVITALAIAWFLVYTVMVLQFQRFRQPLIVMATIPFCLIGVVLGLVLFRSSMSLVALLGVISLGGVVVNNGIILVDYINLLRQRGGAQKDVASGDNGESEGELRDSVVSGSASRLRPIFMTTLTTMLGVVPMALAKGEGSEIYAPLGQAIAGGLLTSTLITLFIIPVLYYVTELHSLQKKKERGKKNLLLLLIPALFLGTSSLGFTQKLPPVSTPYSFTDLLAAMDLNNVDLNKAREAVIQAQLDTKDAKAGYQPTVDLTLAGSYMANPLIKEISLAQGEFGSIPVANPATGQVIQVPLPNTDIKVFDGMPTFGYTFQLDLQQPIFTWGKISNSVKIFSAIESVRQLQLSSLEKQKRGSLKAQITVLSSLTQMEALLTQQQEYAQELVQLTEAAQKQGVVLEQAVLEAKTQEALIPLSLQQIRHNQSVILQELRELTGLHQLDSSQIMHIPQTQGFYESFQELSQQEPSLLEAAALNPAQESLAILEKLHQAAEYGRKVASGSIYGKPDIALQVSFGLNGNMEKLFKGESDLKQDLVANLTLGIKTTLWDGGKKLNQLKRSTSQLKDAELDLEQSRSAIKLELSRQINAMTMAFLKIQYQKLKIQTAQSQLDQKLQLLQSGYGSQREVLQARIEKISEEIKLQEEEINLATAACTVEVMTQLN
ncbi:MAG: efflux RND transporter permease subunit [Treponema sp.]|nr:efflux RND transporter permease subunit [Treponema sp.]